ncbi:MAG TPA: glycosyltransferase [Pyrinomonadaceae bacterium]|nr:glycosyltransferase [Pyrinomonadaceae bacterium]
MLVTVGNATQGFVRLLKAVDAAAGNGVFGEETVFIQAGNTSNFVAAHCRQQDFLEMKQFEMLLRDATLVICHGGTGTLINVLQAGKVPVVMPRQRRYSEHVDDHQVELVDALAEEGRIVRVLEPKDLEDGIRTARAMLEERHATKNTRVLELITKDIEELGRRATVI